MPDSRYEQIRQLARRQATALESGDIAEAVRLLDERQRLLLEAGAPLPDDEAAIHETLTLDRRLAGALRDQMLALRDQAAHVQHGRTAVSGYRPYSGRSPRLLDAQR